jgi:hypothetical protein
MDYYAGIDVSLEASSVQVTTGRLTTLLNDIGLCISKRQVVRLLTGQLDGFAAEDAAVLHAGLVSSSYVTVDDTGARHSHNRTYVICYNMTVGSRMKCDLQ